MRSYQELVAMAGGDPEKLKALEAAEFANLVTALADPEEAEGVREAVATMIETKGSG